MQTVMQDLRHAWRGLTQTPGFSATAVATLGLGIAACTAVFSLLDAVLLQPLPYRDPDRLVALEERLNGVPGTHLSAHEMAAWREQNEALDGIAGHMFAAFNLTGSGDPQTVTALTVTSNYFDVLGRTPELGRTFAPGEDRSGANRIAVLSQRLWQQRFGGQPSALGGSILLDNEAYRIVGVMPSAGDIDPDLWVPIDLPAETQRMGRHGMRVFARLKPDVTIERAENDLVMISKRLEQQIPFLNTGHSARVVPLHATVIGGVKRPLQVIAGAVGFVLLIACANVAHLLLTRGVGRQKEIAIRAALGASRLRLVRFLLIESLLLGLTGGGAGALLATWIVDLLPTITAVDIPRLAEASVNGRVLLVCLLVSLVTGVVCGVIPALRGSRATLTASLGDGARGTGVATARLSGILALSEVALATVLLIGAALMIQSFVRLARVDPGFNPHRALAVPISLPGARYAGPEQRIRAFEDLNGRIAALDAVRAVGGVSQLPLTLGDNRTTFSIDGRPPARPGEELRASIRQVAGDYFRAMEIPLVRGRLFAAADARVAVPLIRWYPQQPRPRRFDEPQPMPVAVINESMANRFWPGEDAVGRQIRILFSPSITIIGVVGDVRHYGLARDPAPEVYLSHLQEPSGTLTIVARTAGDQLSVAGAIREQIRAVDRDLPVSHMRTIEDVLSTSLGRPRFDAWLLGTFGGVAVMLAMLGTYGVTSYAVGQRAREIGIRTALGATRRDVLRVILSRAVAITLAGIAVGVVGGVAVTRFLEKLLFAITPTDAWTFAAVAAGLAVISLLASYLPARHALTIDPLQALRME